MTASDRSPITVGVDGSEPAALALLWAARAAAAEQRPLRIITVVHVPAIYYTEPALAQGVRDELESVADARLSAAANTAAAAVETPLEVVTERHEGKIVDTLVELSNSSAALVLGPRGHGELTGLLVGSVTSAVVGHANCPVVVVRGRTLDGRPPTTGPVVVGVDGSECSEQAVEVAFQHAQAFGAPLVAVNVWSDVSVQPTLGSSPTDPLWSGIQTNEERILSERLAGYEERHPHVPVERVVARDRPVRVLSDYAERAQLIVVGSRGRGGFKGMLLGSTSNALLHTADCPVVIVRGQGQGQG